MFRGGFEITAAEKVIHCGTSKETPPVFDVLQDLCDDSLLIENRNADGEIRFGLLESIRQYANEQLLDQDSIEGDLSGPVARLETQQRHADHYSQYGQKSFLDMLDNSETKDQWNNFFERTRKLHHWDRIWSRATSLLLLHGSSKDSQYERSRLVGCRSCGTVLARRDISERSRKQITTAQRRFLRISGRMVEARGQSNNVQIREDTTQNITETPLHNSPTASPHEDRESPTLDANDLLEQGNLEDTQSFFDKALVFYKQALNIYTKTQCPKRNRSSQSADWTG